MKSGYNLTEIGALPDGGEPQIYRTRTGRIFTDTFNPWASVSSAQSVFYFMIFLLTDDECSVFDCFKKLSISAATRNQISGILFARTSK